MIRRPPRSTLSSSSAASDVYKRQGQHLLNGFDEDLSLCLEESPTFNEINIISNAQLKSINRVNGNLESTLESGNKLLTNNILIATGREPNLLPLNLDFLNLKMDGQYLAVDELNQTNNANIFAVGDIINKPNLTPVAIEQGRVFSDNFFNDTATTEIYTILFVGSVRCV